MSLENKVFEGEESIATFQEFVKIFDNISIEIIGRDAFQKQETITKNDTEGYIIYLPIDVREVELIQIIEELHNFFEVPSYKLDNLYSYIKTVVTILLKSGVKKEEIDSICKENNFSPEFIEKIKKQKYNKNVIKILQSSNNSERLENKIDRQKLETITGNVILKELDFTFLRIAKENLRKHMQVMTSEEQKAWLNEGTKNMGFEQVNDHEYRSGNGIIMVRCHDLPETGYPLRERIKINSWKERLENVRNKGEKEEIERIEKKAV